MMDPPNSPPAPVTADEFTALMAAALTGFDLRPGVRLATAVSGGADSMALALLLDGWCRDRGYELVALTVDHGLRAAAADEARQVAGWLARRNIRHHILRWEGEKPSASLQQAARRARYRLLGEWVAAHSASLLLLAHHQEDQAETFLLRLARGSGVDGLAAMKPLAEFPGDAAGLPARDLPPLCRPLLDLPRARLRATLRTAGQAWIEDPSNDDRRHARVRVRHFLERREIDGLTPRRLADTARRMGRVQGLLEDLTTQAMHKVATLDPLGFAALECVALAETHPEIALRLLARLIREVGGGDYAPRFEKIEKLYRAVLDPAFSGQTLGGSQLRRRENPHNEQAEIVLFREGAAITDEAVLRPGRPLLWDRRFRLMSRTDGGRVTALGARRWRELCGDRPGLGDRWPAAPREALWTLPCLLTDDGGVRLPHFLTTFPAEEPAADGELLAGFVRFPEKTP